MLAGTIFEGAVAAADLDALQRTRRVTQAILVEGRNRVRIHEPTREAPAGFEPATPTLRMRISSSCTAKPAGNNGEAAVPAGARVPSVARDADGVQEVQR
jgi:hypothetical protein